ncbi:MAG: PhnD/SsuA/transferrin family substrate-binding protein [Acidimicrobiia bacterium]|nr:PhnD/SsuA/transferrin family substrate-binding protein [Acidimicrobiia bacterium]
MIDTVSRVRARRKMRTVGVFRSLLVMVVLALLVAACGDGGGTTDTTEASDDAGDTTAAGGDDTTVADGATTMAASEEMTELTVMLPVDSPNMYGFRVADANGYFEKEGLDVTMEFVDGSGAAIQLLLAGTGQIASVGTGTVAEALEQGHDDIRAIGNTNYGSVFFLTVPTDSDIETPADLEGAQIGISELSGGEVPVVRGIVEGAGFDVETDVELVPIGAGTALAVQAIENDQVDAYGGSINDVIAVEVQGLDLRTLDPGDLGEVPALPLVTTQSVIDADPDSIEGFLRAVARGAEFGQTNPDETLAILMEQSPEQFTDETGELIFEAVLDLWMPPEGVLFHEQSVESWEHFFDIIAAEVPEGTDLDTVIVDDFVEAANDF